MKTAHTLAASIALFIASLVLFGLNYHPETPTYTPGDTLPTIPGETAPEQARTLDRPEVVRISDDVFISTAYDEHNPGDIFEVYKGAAWLTGTGGQIIPDIDWFMGDTTAPDGVYMINDAGELVSLGEAR